MHNYFADADDVDQARREIALVAEYNTRPMEESLAALQVVLQERYPEGTLSRLVAWDGNWVLEDPTDTGARAFLVELAGMLRTVIDQSR